MSHLRDTLRASVRMVGGNPDPARRGAMAAPVMLPTPVANADDDLWAWNRAIRMLEGRG